MIYMVRHLVTGDLMILSKEEFHERKSAGISTLWKTVFKARSCCDLLLKIYEQEKDNKRTRYYVRRDSWRRNADNFASDEMPHFHGLNPISGFIREVYETKIRDDYSYGYYDDEFDFISELWVMDENGETIRKVTGFDTFSERKPDFEKAPMRKRGNRTYEISKKREKE